MATAAITGTATASITEADIVAGAKTIIATLTGDTFVPAVGTPTFSAATTSGTTAADSAGGGGGRTGNGDLTCTFPSGYTPVADHFALMILYSDQGSGSLPTDWTEITGSPFGVGTEKLQIFIKVLVGGESAPVTTISGSGTNISHCANMAIYTGVGSVGAIGTPSNGTGTPMTAAAIVTTVNNSIVCACSGRGDNEVAGSQTFGGSATGVAERLDGGTAAGSDSEVSMADKTIATSGTDTGAASSTTSITDPWVSVIIELVASTPFDNARAALASGLDSGQAEAAGWDAKVKPNIPVANVVRTSNTVCTITLQAQADYDITAQETITWTIPASAVALATPITGSPTFTVDFIASAVTMDSWYSGTAPPYKAVLRKNRVPIGVASRTITFVEIFPLDWERDHSRIVRPKNRVPIGSPTRSSGFTELFPLDWAVSHGVDLGRVVRPLKSGKALFVTDMTVPSAAEDITQDKWTGNIGRIVRPLLAGRASFEIDSNQLTQVETAQLDKWIGDLGRIVLRRLTGRATSDIDTAQLASAEASSIDRWLGDQGRVVRRKIGGRFEFTQDPRALASAEFSSIDRWLGDLGRIVRRKTPGKAYSEIDASQLTRPESASLDRWIGELGRIVRPKIAGRFSFDTDYAALARTEATSPDRWLGDRGRIVYRLLQGRGTTDFTATEGVVNEIFTLDKWTPPRSQLIYEWRYRVRPWDVIDTSQLTQTERSTLDKWIESVGRRLPLPQQPTRERLAQDYTFAQFETLTSDKWTGSLAVGKAPRQPIRPRFDIDANQLTQAERFTIDKWIESVGRKLPLPLQPTRDRFVYDILFAQFESLTMDKWNGSFAAGKILQPPTRPRFDIDSRALTVSEFASLDRWIHSTGRRLPLPLQPLRDRFIYDLLFAQFEGITSDKWTGSFAAGRGPLQPTRPRFDIDASQLTRSEAGQLDKWIGHLGRVVQRLKSGRGYSEIDELLLTRAEYVDIGKFGPSRVIARSAQHPTRPRFDIDATLLTQGEAGQIDKWLGSLGRVVRRVPTGYGTVYFIQIPGLEDVSQVASMMQAYPDFARLRKIGGEASYIIDPKSLTASETITLDKWFRDASLTPARWRGAVPPTRTWYAPEFTSILILFNLPDVYNSSTVPAVADKSTVAVVVMRSTVPVNPHNTEKP